MSDRAWAIGLVGTENSHAEEIIKYLNSDPPAQSGRIVGIAGGPTDRNRYLAGLGSIGTIVDDPREFLGSVDAMIITSRDGRVHPELAIPFLEAGVPVWVDKPLACSVADAAAIVDAADRGGSQVTSYSALRWIPDTQALVAEATRVGALQTVTVTGPADPASPYAGIFFYGIHAADVARRLAPGPSTAAQVVRVGSTVIARYATSGPEVTLQFVEPDGDKRVPFHATVVGRQGVASRELRLGEGYVRPGVDAFTTMLASGKPPLTRPEMTDPVAVLAQVAAAL